MPLVLKTKSMAIIKLHNKSILECAAAPCNRIIDPTYCLVQWQYTWQQFNIISKYYPEAQNFPLLSHLAIDYVQKSTSCLVLAMPLHYILGYQI